jgi:hypothetical protein
MIAPLIYVILALAGSWGCAARTNVSADAAVSLPRQIFFVRHTEREPDGEDPPLTAIGEARALALADALRDAGIDALITTQWQRTKNTAKPLASILRITPQIVPVLDGKARENLAETAAALRRYSNQVVLVVGHVTVTGVITALGGPSLPNICDNVYSDLFLFTPALGQAGLTHLRYGAVEDISPRCRITRPLPEP